MMKKSLLRIKKIKEILHYGKKPKKENLFGKVNGEKEDQVGMLSAQ